MSSLTKTKTKMAAAISAQIKRTKLTQLEAAERTGVTQSRISRVISGDLDKTSAGTLLEMLEALGGVVRVVIRKPRDGERARITVIDKLGQDAPPLPGKPPPEVDDFAALAGLLAKTQRKLINAEARLQFLEGQIEELGGSAFQDLMDAAILLSRSRSSGDPEAEITARERVEAAVQALLDWYNDIHESDE